MAAINKFRKHRAIIDGVAIRAYSLTELAIVLAILGIVLGGIWGVASYVQESVKRERMLEQVTLIVQNVRSFYAGRANIVGNAAVVTDDLLRRTIMPPEMIRNTAAANLVADHPWGSVDPAGALIAGGGVTVDDSTAGGTGSATQFRVTLNGLAEKSCAYLAMHLDSSSGPPGLLSLRINGGAALVPPIRLNTAIARCLDPPASNSIAIIYRLRDSST